MAANTSPIFVLTPTLDPTTITSAETTVAQVITTGKSTEGTRIDMIIVTSSSSTSQILRFDMYNNATSASFHVGDVTLVTNAGYSGTASREAVAVLSPTLGYLVVPSGYSLRAYLTATISSGTCTITAWGGTYA